MKIKINEKKKSAGREKFCKSKATREYGKKTSLYRSMALSKCRKGKIWKEAIEAGVQSSILEEQLLFELESIKDLGDDTATLDDGTHVCEACLYETLTTLDENVLEEAEYHGRKVTLNKPMRGDVKKFKVFVKDPKTGNVKKVNFGDPNMRIKKSNPKRRKSFRARHHCENPGPKTKSRYWSCRKW